MTRMRTMASHSSDVCNFRVIIGQYVCATGLVLYAELFGQLDNFTMFLGWTI